MIIKTFYRVYLYTPKDTSRYLKIMQMKIINLLILIVLFSIFFILYRKYFLKRKETFKEEDFQMSYFETPPADIPNESEGESCKRTPRSKEISDIILNKLTSDLMFLYGNIEKIRSIVENLKFYPLECCNLEDSMTEDKKKVFVCVKGKDGRFYNYNKLLQVAIHELAHAISKLNDPDHKTPEFNQNYKFLIQKAVNLNFIDLSKLDMRK